MSLTWTDMHSRMSLSSSSDRETTSPRGSTADFLCGSSHHWARARRPSMVLKKLSQPSLPLQGGPRPHA